MVYTEREKERERGIEKRVFDLKIGTQRDRQTENLRVRKEREREIKLF